MIKKSAFSVLICSIILFLGINAHAQFMLDTLNTVEIRGTKITRKPNFSTFVKGISFAGSSFTSHNIGSRNSTSNYIYPLAFKIKNEKEVLAKLDSLFVKSKDIDTSLLEFSLNVYCEDKLFSSSAIKLIKKEGSINTFVFEKLLLLPKKTAYLGFSIKFKSVPTIELNEAARENAGFTFYTNKKVEGYRHSYNEAKDEFKLIPCEDCPPATCPQVKIYYTKLEE